MMFIVQSLLIIDIYNPNMFIGHYDNTYKEYSYNGFYFK